MSKPQVAIVDYRMGNLFSVQQACSQAGMEARITSSPEQILSADAVILPGVGAFGDAMAALQELGLVEPIRRVADSGKPLIGICLGLQLLMSESTEFGHHKGLDLIKGRVVQLEISKEADRMLKVPQIGWNRIQTPEGVPWRKSLLEGISDGEFMYFVHSFFARPEDPKVILSLSRYGSTTFCSGLRKKNIMAFQFHPERSGPWGIRIYQNLCRQILSSKEKEGLVHV